MSNIVDDVGGQGDDRTTCEVKEATKTAQNHSEDTKGYRSETLEAFRVKCDVG